MSALEVERVFLNLLPRLGDLEWNVELDRKEESIALTRELVEQGECVVALEILCQNLYDFDVPIGQSVFQQIEKLAALVKMPEDDWIFLSEIVVDADK